MKKMGGRCPEGCITDRRDTRLEETEWGQRRKEAPFEVGQGPETAATLC